MFRDMDRAMPPAGAADRDADIGFPLSAIARNQQFEQAADLRHRGGIGGVCRNISGNVGVQPSARAQHGVPVRVAQEPHVEDQIGIARDAAGETERLDRQHRRVAARHREGRPHLLREHVGAEVGGVDQTIRPFAQRRQQLALAGDAVARRPSRVRAPIPNASGCAPSAAPCASGASNRRSSRASGRLSTTSHPRSSSVFSTVDLPAPDRPVTSRMSLVINTSLQCGQRGEGVSRGRRAGLADRPFDLQRGRGVMRVEGKLADGDPCEQALSPLGHAIGLAAQMHDQRDRQVIDLWQADDAEAPHLDPATDACDRR
ncbi:hypothetical protein WR25_11112 [Diploscapter pachys]|uniref:Uncharacterized protein n=1 Tax=Diploscapter pachys TaxID=2018661 RepID=A0A2A2KBY2_9BILA|nr:hypothetical protein WR25_11112 [Diploscapter pachys]